MGDLVLTMDEVNPVMTKLAAGGIEITALHNHLLRNQPFTMYMHVQGNGDPVKLAGVLHTALAESKTPLSTAAAPSPTPPPIDLDTAAIDQALGAKGTNNGGVYQFGIPRAEPIKDDGMDVPPAMGSAIAINFQPTGGGKAAITGDFVLIAKEVNPVLKACAITGSRSRRSTTTCSTTNRTSTSCTSGPMTTPGSSPKDSRQRSRRSISQRAERVGGDRSCWRWQPDVRPPPRWRRRPARLSCSRRRSR